MQKPSEESLQHLYQWVDKFPLSKPKRDIRRDFSDGTNLTEMIKFSFPQLIDLHNYSPSNSIAQKTYNWNTLNQKVFRKMGFQLTKKDIESVVSCRRWAIENVLLDCSNHFEAYAKQVESRRLNRKAKKQQKKFDPHDIMMNGISPKHERVGEPRIDEDIHELLTEKDRVNQHLSDKIDILELKVSKLQQLLTLKDSKIQSLTERLRSL